MNLVRHFVTKNNLLPLSITVFVPNAHAQAQVEAVNQAIQVLMAFDAELPEPKKVQFKIIKSKNVGSHLWIQDYFIALQNREQNGSVKLLEDKKRSESGGGPANQLVHFFNSSGQESKFFLSKSKLNFKGGNVIFIGQYALVGIDTWLIENPLLSQEKFKQHFANDVGLESENIILIRSQKSVQVDEIKPGYLWLKFPSYQPFYHIDLFITPAGRDSNGRFRLLIGAPVYDGDLHHSIFYQTKQNVDRIADELNRRSDFIIYRNPLPLTYVDTFIEKDQKITLARKWFFAAYNNCLVQYTSNSTQSFVLLPQYAVDYSNEFTGFYWKDQAVFGGNWSDLNQFDQKNKAIWEELGFKVMAQLGCLPLILKGGGIRCFTKVLQRISID